ncbi:acyltransferase-domain-containing protein [Naematelia encephala]|uniref:Acyltransferase-domain-containing protein n=1 Tax=Naematelia encephala TaxID=71784 RepID=A0A1Y2AM74_9TREE|nr:acyltransferase-domain-containing protein [Naematelia encephala]
MAPSPPLYTIPIKDRPPHGPLTSKILFPILFNLANLGVNSAQFCAVPLLLIPLFGRRLYESVIGWTKDGYGRCLIMITVLFGPTSLVITTDAPPDLAGLVERDDSGQMTRINLPDRLVVMANHQAYTDWMYLWILACYAGHARGITILLKAALKKVPVVGWGMQFFRFIFLNRSWAADRDNLTKALTRLAREARDPAETAESDGTDESASLLAKARHKTRSPLWLLIFPEGTIPSDEERAKSVKYANREGVDDFVTLLHPRSTGLLFCLRTLIPQVPDLKLLDLTIGYPGIPLGNYPQDHYGLLSVFFRSVPPPTVHLHMHLYSDLSSPDSGIPSLISPRTTEIIEGEGKDDSVPPGDTGLATKEEARAFELWIRDVWTKKEQRMKAFYAEQKFVSSEGGESAREIIPIRQTRWYHWFAAYGGGGMGTVAVIGVAIGALFGIRQ